MKLFSDAFSFATLNQTVGMPESIPAKKLFARDSLTTEGELINAELCGTSKLFLITGVPARLPKCRRLTVSSLASIGIDFGSLTSLDKVIWYPAWISKIDLFIGIVSAVPRTIRKLVVEFQCIKMAEVEQVVRKFEVLRNVETLQI